MCCVQSKQKKMREKYRDQDEEEREFMISLLAVRTGGERGGGGAKYTHNTVVVWCAQ